MKDRKRIKLMTGHTAAPTLPCMGWYLVEIPAHSQRFSFSYQPEARAIIARHNALFRAKHGDAAADAEDAAHARLCARVREHNRKCGFTDAEIDEAYSAARARQEKRGIRQSRIEL